MYAEDELLPISALQHLAFCERQAALIHVEGEWQENPLTVEGHGLHEKAHESEIEQRQGIFIVRGLRVRSLLHGLVGAIDVVEFSKIEGDETGCLLPGFSGRYQPYIIEYKRGRPKLDSCDEVQLCAQALCLEEMLGVAISESAFFYGQPRRRHAVSLSECLRNETKRMAERFHEMIRRQETPPPQSSPKCENCSLFEYCGPETPRERGVVSKYIAKMIDEVISEETA